jgi:hypothetical protein
MKKTRIIASALLLSATCSLVAAAGPKIPILYSTDLFHPHGDPDDHYDLAALFAIDAFDIKGIILDLGATQKKRIGRPPLEQMMKITGRDVPYAVGLSQRFRSRTDKALEEPAEFQGAVNLILSVLRASKEEVVITTTGSCRDVAAAFNREPELLKEKVKAVYINIGAVPKEQQGKECNVGYDPLAYYRMLESGLPVYWCPCIGVGAYKTGYSIDHATVIGACSPPVQNYFVYCLTKSKADPIEFLATGPHPVPTSHVVSWNPKSSSRKGMWCTGPMFHAAGWKIYQRATDDFVALPPVQAEEAGLTDQVVEAFGFEPIRVTLETVPPRPPALGEPTAGELSAAFVGEENDRVGTSKLAPDGRPDCQVRLLGVAPGKPIGNLVLTGPRTGRWEHVATERWWRVAYERDKNHLDAYFQFYADGEHQIQVLYGDGTSQTATFGVRRVAPIRLRAQFDPAEPNCHVFRTSDKRYHQILASCLKNLLAGLGQSPRGERTE